MSEQGSGMILNRGRQPRASEESQVESAQSAEPQTNNTSKMEAIAQMTTNSTLASQFPGWDLKPPATLLKRRSSKLV